MVEVTDANRRKQKTESVEVSVAPPALFFFNLQFSPRCLNQNVAANTVTRELANYFSLWLKQPKITDASSRASSKVPNGDQRKERLKMHLVKPGDSHTRGLGRWGELENKQRTGHLRSCLLKLLLQWAVKLYFGQDDMSLEDKNYTAPPPANQGRNNSQPHITVGLNLYLVKAL